MAAEFGRAGKTSLTGCVTENGRGAGGAESGRQEAEMKAPEGEGQRPKPLRRFGRFYDAKKIRKHLRVENPYATRTESGLHLLAQDSYQFLREGAKAAGSIAKLDDVYLERGTRQV